MDKTVSDYMQKNIVNIDAQSSLLEAINAMRRHAVSSLLIQEGGNTVGIFTERDLLTRVDFIATGGVSSIKLKDIMTTGLKTANHDESYVSVMELMQKYGVRHMPVVKDGSIVGIVSLRDLLNHYYENIEHLLAETVAALSSAVEKRDPYTAGHQQRVAQLAYQLAKELGLNEKEVSGVSMAAVIHDIGKVYVPSEILNKPGTLSEAEFTLIKIHPQVGYDILKPIEFPWPIADIVLQHHERINGSGYPSGLTADKILFESKIIAVADVVEAMASHRPYRPALGIEKALEEINSRKGIFYDMAVAEACIKLFTEKKFAFNVKIY
ncbi:MAG: CBS domain-containing protein [Candidatus Omnitrophica bacterium]|jgi:putative nucleotidyltransferase with HDIG domain|nr:CBS domain-containing protein [Candidatus Omnitrophota bacterium]